MVLKKYKSHKDQLHNQKTDHSNHTLKYIIYRTWKLILYLRNKTHNVFPHITSTPGDEKQYKFINSTDKDIIFQTRPAGWRGKKSKEKNQSFSIQLYVILLPSDSRKNSIQR